jgi:hypothetical protein
VTEAEKRCLACGRWFSWRKKWESCWEQVAYCSKSCRTMRLSEEERSLTPVLFELLEERAAPKTLCPSEVARRASADDWRRHMPVIRDIVGRLASFGAVTVTRRGEPIDPRFVSGLFRVGAEAPKKRKSGLKPRRR